MRNVLMCVLLTCAYGCDDEGSTVTPTSVPPIDMAAAPSTDLAAGGGPVADMASAPGFPTTASVTVGPNNSLSYAPATVDIAAGGTVTWTWAAGITMPHTVTSGDTPAAFPSSPVQTSGTYQATFPTAGTFSYFCTVHGRIMSGTVNVH
jgi:plastocyanin